MNHLHNYSLIDLKTNKSIKLARLSNTEVSQLNYAYALNRAEKKWVACSELLSKFAEYKIGESDLTKNSK